MLRIRILIGSGSDSYRIRVINSEPDQADRTQGISVGIWHTQKKLTSGSATLIKKNLTKKFKIAVIVSANTFKNSFACRQVKTLAIEILSAMS